MLPWPPETSSDGGPLLRIQGGRHPLVEAHVGRRYFTANDAALGGAAPRLLILTGPNMGGKSTYLRMVALVCVLAQCGSLVPARAARLPVLGRIYTRVGASDRLARGESTFMVEMTETAAIVNTCAPGSLIILDEVGRGTSTYDGISIAKAVVEHLCEHPARPLVLFATHFFELTDLPDMLPAAANAHVAVARGGSSVPLADSQQGGASVPLAEGEAGQPEAYPTGSADAAPFVFLYRVEPGPASDSFGIEVAALAGLPEPLIARARAILGELEDARALAREHARRAIQLGLFK